MSCEHLFKSANDIANSSRVVTKELFKLARSAIATRTHFLCFVVIVVVIIVNVAVGIFTTETPKQSKFNKIELRHFENSTTCRIMN